MYPKELRYTQDHEWVRLEGEVGTVGITHHAQSELGDIVFVDLPEPGTAVGRGDEFGTVESVKAVSEMYSPVGGEVVEVNSALEDAPETVNSDPYGEGWMVKFRLADPAELESLMDAEQYTAHVEQESA
jgi:glycine cleavage system H protein